MTIFNYSRIWKEEKEIIVGRDGLEYGVIKAKDGHKWLDRNLGATRVATSSTDTQSYGDYYQWGRELDGHEKSNSSTTSIISSNIKPGHGDFILTSSSPHDWVSPRDNTLWDGTNAPNNVCPVGFRVPTKAEYNILFTAEGITNMSTAFQSPLKFSSAGKRDRTTGAIGDDGTSIRLWTSDVSALSGSSIYVTSSTANTSVGYSRSFGASVRCIKDY